jgi:hypothetical protein
VCCIDGCEDDVGCRLDSMPAWGWCQSDRDEASQSTSTNSIWSLLCTWGMLSYYQRDSYPDGLGVTPWNHHSSAFNCVR